MAVFITGTSVYAQKVKTGTGNNDFSINAGVEGPSGNFEKGDYSDEKPGFSKTGLHLNLSAVHYFNKNLGIGLLLGYT